MKSALLFAIGLLFQAHTALAQTCDGRSVVDCIGYVARTDGCHYDFTTNECYAGAATDSCQGLSSSTACANAGCFYDPHITKCLASLSQARFAFSCPYWQNSFFLQADTNGVRSPACLYHGCAFDSETSTCATIASGGTITNVNSNTYAQNARFVNAAMKPDSLIFTVQLVTDVIQNALQPQWPSIQILSPRIGLETWSNEVNATCSSFDAQASAGPQSFVGTPVSAPYLTANFNQFQFSDPELVKFFGYMSVGSSFLVKSVVTDGTTITYELEFDLSKVNTECAARGVGFQDTDAGRTYSVPISYVERGVGDAYMQTSQTFDIAIQTTGQILIATTAPYHQRVFPIEVVYVNSDCGANRARQRITWQLSMLDQFNADEVVGPRSASDITVVPGSNCFGDTVVAFESYGCSPVTASCNFRFATQTRCRTRTEDGQAFNLCSYSDAADRIADLGSDIAYNTNLNGIHSLELNSYVCPTGSTTVGCVLSNPTADNSASTVTASITRNDFLSTTSTSNPFQAVGGFLPTPTSGPNTFMAMDDLFGDNTTNVNGFDGNLFSYQPLTVLLLLPTASQNAIDLRLELTPGNFTIYPVDRQAQRLSAGQVLDWAMIAPNTIYTAKNAYDDGNCAVNGNCETMPACTGIRGCDGFSVPSSILLALSPANGYQFDLRYRVGLPNQDGTPGTARKLLQVNSVSDETFIGTARFTIQILQNATDTSGPIYQIADVQVRLDSQMNKDAVKSAGMTVLPVLFGGIAYYWTVVGVSRFSAGVPL